MLTLNIDGYEVDRSNLTRIFAAHIAKDERSGTNPEEILGREHIDPLVDTLLKHFGKTRRGCCSGQSQKKMTAKEVQVAPVDDNGNWQQPLEPGVKTEFV